MPQAWRAAFWKIGEREWATGSPMTPRRTGGLNEVKREGFEIKSEAENVASAFMLGRGKQAALRVARVPLRDMAAEWLATPKAGVKGLA